MRQNLFDGIYITVSLPTWPVSEVAEILVTYIGKVDVSICTFLLALFTGTKVQILTPDIHWQG
jgi:hypothetical protein